MNKVYILKFLPLFEEDLNDIVDYIKYKLQNPKAAENLIDEIEAAILARLSNPKAFERFQTAKKKKAWVL